MPVECRVHPLARDPNTTVALPNDPVPTIVPRDRKASGEMRKPGPSLFGQVVNIRSQVISTSAQYATATRNSITMFTGGLAALKKSLVSSLSDPVKVMDFHLSLAEQLAGYAIKSMAEGIQQSTSNLTRLIFEGVTALPEKVMITLPSMLIRAVYETYTHSEEGTELQDMRKSMLTKYLNKLPTMIIDSTESITVIMGKTMTTALRFLTLALIRSIKITGGQVASLAINGLQATTDSIANSELSLFVQKELSLRMSLLMEQLSKVAKTTGAVIQSITAPPNEKELTVYSQSRGPKPEVALTQNTVTQSTKDWESLIESGKAISGITTETETTADNLGPAEDQEEKEGRELEVVKMQLRYKNSNAEKKASGSLDGCNIYKPWQTGKVPVDYTFLASV